MPSLLGRPIDAVLREISASISSISASISASEAASETAASDAISPVLGAPSRLWCGPPAFLGRCARRAFCSLLSSAVALLFALLPLRCGPLAVAPHAALL